MKTTDLLVQDLELSIDPDLEDRHFGWVDIEFRVIGDPEYLDDLGALTADFGLDIELNVFPNPLINDIDEEEQVGEIEVEATSIIEGEEDEFEEYITQWQEENYRSLPFIFRYHIESAFISEIMAPLSNLLNNTFRGIVPQVTFTESPPDIETDELEIEISGYDVGEEDRERLQELIEQFHEETEEQREEFQSEMEDLFETTMSLKLSFTSSDDGDEED